MGHSVKYIGVLSANDLRPLPDFSLRECLAKIAPINNIYWNAFCINHVKMLIINIKSEEVLKIFKIVSGSPPGWDLSKQDPKYLVRLSL
jgi:hypothetical protein